MERRDGEDDLQLITRQVLGNFLVAPQCLGPIKLSS